MDHFGIDHKNFKILIIVNNINYILYIIFIPYLYASDLNFYTWIPYNIYDKNLLSSELPSWIWIKKVFYLSYFTLAS